jgi:hypothetical protein
VASVDTYLRFAEAVNRLDISQDKQGLPGLVGGSKQSAATRVTKGVIEGVGDKLREFAEPESERASRRRRSTNRCHHPDVALLPIIAIPAKPPQKRKVSSFGPALRQR